MMHVRMIFVCLCGLVGLAGLAYSPAEAQSIFNKHKSGDDSSQSSGAGADAKKQIFIKPKSSQSNSAASGFKARDQKSLFVKNNVADNKSKKFASVNPYTFSKQQKLTVSQMKQETSGGEAFLQDWKAKGRTKPETPSEIQQYAAAQRSVSENMMFTRRQQLMAHLEKQTVRVPVRSSGESSTRVSGAFGRGGFARAGGGSSSVPSEKAVPNSKPSIYIRKKTADEENAVLPKRIFNSVR